MSRADRVARRRDPSIILPRVQSVIMHPGGGRAAAGRTGASGRYAQDRGVVSSYAWGADYHGVLGGRLKRLGAHLNAVAGGVGRFYVDTGAILERDFAERAGLGFVGKNSLVIHPRGGSGFFIGELFSTVALPRDGDEDAGVVPRGKGKPGCGACSKCRVACPTGAIVQDYQVDARRCISYLTIELKGAIPVGLRRGVGNRVYGCDICQLVCPWNRVEWGKKAAPRGGYSPMFGSVAEDVATPRLTELVCMSDEEFEQRFRESAVYRIGRERMARNAAVALGNVGGRDELAVVEEVARRDGSELVREHAQWAAREIRDRLARGGGGGGVGG
ncbi:unnamed protein product [Chondrus crispus]|uniref:4Fe-4S ferredoxin-type domain-containing protein n=1 Tax=Chondrus crispus TaxID=2769 RepID=R7QAC0_CHOCR|nr:unnamed protein product [Chondrus crispus]CDF35462.1 unnamed protein product [Chondrus crispus]|eukprot:XP_005715281.1 unnamed protein product [Chondrus crispus]